MRQTPSRSFSVPGEKLGLGWPVLLAVLGWLWMGVGFSALLGVAKKQPVPDPPAEATRRVRPTIPAVAPSVTPTQLVPGTVQEASLALSTPKVYIAEPAAAHLDCPPLFQAYFEPNRTQPPDSLQPQIQLLSNWLLRHPEAILMLSGHTDSTGSREVNEQLAKARAESLAQRFLLENIPVARLALRSVASDESLGQSSPAAGDRRVSLIVIGGPTDCEVPR